MRDRGVICGREATPATGSVEVQMSMKDTEHKKNDGKTWIARCVVGDARCYKKLIGNIAQAGTDHSQWGAIGLAP
jgi:hypothetical protein